MNKSRFMVLALVLATTALIAACSDDDEPSVSYIQTERMAIPALNTVLIVGDANKDAYNQSNPVNDVGTYTTVATTRISGLRTAVGAVVGFPAEDSPGISAATLAGILIPDVVTINFANPVAFPNGRQLTDDVIDTALKLVLNRQHPAVSDAINANDRPFLGAFPYMATPN